MSERPAAKKSVELDVDDEVTPPYGRPVAPVAPAPIKRSADPVLRIISSMRDSQPMLIEKTPPKGVTISIPIGKHSLEFLEICMKTRLKSVDELVDKFEQIAAEENADLTHGLDLGSQTLNILLVKKVGVTYRSMSPANRAFIELFDCEEVPADPVLFLK